MDYISFIGCRKTSNELLNKVKLASVSPSHLIENLRSINIFKSVTPPEENKNKNILIEEASKYIRVRAHSNGKRSFSLSFPNIFGFGEMIKADYNNPNDCLFSLSIPSFSKSRVIYNKILTGSEVKSYNDKKTTIRRAELSTGTHSAVIGVGGEYIRDFLVYFVRCNANLLGISSFVKLGFTAHNESNKKIFTPFLKLMGSKSIGYATDWFTSSIKISVGRLFGSSNLTEKFFLGPEVRGYRQLAISPVSHNKKVGGNSFISMRTQAGVFVGPVELFAFGDAGVTSVHGLQQCYEIVSAFADNNCLGKSIGCGVSLKNNKSISFIYSVPLTKNEEVENYTLTMDMKF